MRTKFSNVTEGANGSIPCALHNALRFIKSISSPQGELSATVVQIPVCATAVRVLNTWTFLGVLVACAGLGAQMRNLTLLYHHAQSHIPIQILLMPTVNS